MNRRLPVTFEGPGIRTLGGSCIRQPVRLLYGLYICVAPVRTLYGLVGSYEVSPQSRPPEVFEVIEDTASLSRMRIVCWRPSAVLGCPLLWCDVGVTT